MRQPQNAKRGRGRGRRGNGGGGGNHVPNRNTSYESNGPDGKLRGNAQQLHEKYIALAHDASSSGERIAAEAYSQFADHYFRLHQAAVGAAETKRQQEQAAQAANGVATDAKPEAANVDADKAGATDNSAASSDDVETTNKNGNGQRRARVKPVEDDDVSSLSPAQIAEAVQDEQDSNKVAS
ncbi:MAG: DUF4167 domain-containing protein [Candidatus Puniceispirillum sp.]